MGLLSTGCGGASPEPSADGLALCARIGVRCEPADTADAGPDAPAPAEPAALQGITEAHNAARRDRGLPELVWDDELAAVAAGWAAACDWRHNPNRQGYGENLAGAVGRALSGPEATALWLEEEACYNYAADSCHPEDCAGAACGHYTQVVWRATRRIGCAENHCQSGFPGGSGAWHYVVCNYDPPGNIIGQRPY